MSKLLEEKAKEYLKAELSIIPVLEDKTPAVSWTPYQSERIKAEEVEGLFNKAKVKGLAVICGKISGGLEAVDIDCKYDLTGKLWANYSSLIKESLPELYTKLVIAKSKNGGYHIFYKTTGVLNNKKLAERPATIEEKAKGDKTKVLIETRGEGGYILVEPSPGYSFIQGDIKTVSTITQEQRDIILSIARSFNELEAVEVKREAIAAPSAPHGLSPFEDYNNRGDILGLLEAKGWKVVGRTSERVTLLRPGSTDSKSSGNFHLVKRVLFIFSSSTEFRTDKGYSPSQVFSLLECNGDDKTAYRRLLELGYGERYNSSKRALKELKTDLIRVEVVNKVNRVSSVISHPGESLLIEALSAPTGEEDIVISSPGVEAQEETLKAIELILQTGKRIYIREGGDEIREYRYVLKAIFNKYGKIQEESGGLTDRERDGLLDELVILSTKLQPIDKDIFLNELLEEEAIKELRISQESLSITVERLTTTKNKEAQNKEFKKLLSEAQTLQERGETEKAIELLDKGVKEVRITGAKDLLPPPLTYEGLIKDISSLPPAYKTGYPSLDEFTGFTPGAITLIAGRPSHGKTTLMFNLLLEMSALYQRESFYFFTYEEPLKNISVKLLNRLTGSDLSGYFREVRDLAKPTNYEFIKRYIKDNRTDIEEIEEGKRKLQELVDSQRIRIIDKNYSVEELYSLIAYLAPKEKIGAVFIDYIQRMKTARKTQDKKTEIAHISDSVLQIAKDSGLPVILGAQLNRATQEGRDKKPRLENLKESGNLEEDANTVLSVYNESREKEETPEGESYKEKREVSLEIKAQKNREGEVNKSTILTFDKWSGVIIDGAAVMDSERYVF